MDSDIRLRAPPHTPQRLGPGTSEGLTPKRVKQRAGCRPGATRRLPILGTGGGGTPPYPTPRASQPGNDYPSTFHPPSSPRFPVQFTPWTECRRLHTGFPLPLSPGLVGISRTALSQRQYGAGRAARVEPSYPPAAAGPSPVPSAPTV